MRMIQRMLMLSLASLVVVDLAEKMSAEEQRETGDFRYAVALCATVVSRHRFDSGSNPD